MFINKYQCTFLPCLVADIFQYMLSIPKRILHIYCMQRLASACYQRFLLKKNCARTDLRYSFDSTKDNHSTHIFSKPQVELSTFVLVVGCNLLWQRKSVGYGTAERFRNVQSERMLDHNFWSPQFDTPPFWRWTISRGVQFSARVHKLLKQRLVRFFDCRDIHGDVKCQFLRCNSYNYSRTTLHWFTGLCE